MTTATSQLYGTGSNSDIGTQYRTDYYYKKALVEAAKEQYFGQLASSRAMPKNMGKTIKQYHYLPVLDDRNVNDQGIDAEGALASAGTVTGDVTHPFTAAVSVLETGQPASQTKYFVAHNVTSDAAALAEAKGKVVAWAYFKGYTTSQDIDSTSTAADIAAAYVELVDASADALNTTASPDYTVTAIAGSDTSLYGNFYGSSKDVSTITAKLPALSETGGRVNRVGMKRIDISGSLEKFGFFDEYSQESLDFDTDSELMSHMTQEMVKAANELTEDQLQIELLNAAGVIRYTGSATSTTTLQGDDVTNPFASGNTNDAVDYDDLVKLGIELDQNRSPKNTKIIAGSRMTDTKVVNAARYMYIGSELIPTVMRMTDYHDNKAFIPVAQYASAGNVARGEIGAIDNWRFIVVPEMMHWNAVGAEIADAVEATTNYRYSTTADGATLNYDVFPMLSVGSESFATIGFQTNGKTVKFKIKHVKPENNHSSDDPYGETGFMSIKWYFGFLALRPERIALIKTIAEW